jgi:F-type H+-transporting ATPase subunit b
MEQIFETLKGIIVRALPTFFLVIVLHWFLKKVLFQPMERVLEERRKKTQGAVEASEAMLARVHDKMAEYETALGNARAEIFHEQEESRKKLAGQQAGLVEAARAAQAERVAEVKRGLAGEAQQAKATLANEAERLAEQIAGAVLAGRVQ